MCTIISTKRTYNKKAKKKIYIIKSQYEEIKNEICFISPKVNGLVFISYQFWHDMKTSPPVFLLYASFEPKTPEVGDQ